MPFTHLMQTMLIHTHTHTHTHTHMDLIEQDVTKDEREGKISNEFMWSNDKAE